MSDPGGDLRHKVRDPLDDVAEPDGEELAVIEAEEYLLDDDLDELRDDDGGEELAPAGPVGRLVAPGAEDDGFDFVDDEADAIARSFVEDDLSAEEEAVHLTADPPYGEPGDGYLDSRLD